VTGTNAIPDDLMQFVGATIKSVWTLELLLYLWRSAGRPCSTAELVRELRASDSIVSDGLAALQSAGLVSPEGQDGVRYAPVSSTFDYLVQQLAQLYRERPVMVTNAIFAGPDRRIRNFAEAFRLTKKD
jgi:hypothetical protein